MADDRLVNILEEFLLLYKFVNRKTIVEKLQQELKDEQLREIYQNSNGEKSTREVAASLKNKCSHAKVATLWNKWALLGIVIPAKQKGRYKAAFNLDEYGISGVIEDGEDKN